MNPVVLLERSLVETGGKIEESAVGMILEDGKVVSGAAEDATEEEMIDEGEVEDVTLGMDSETGVDVRESVEVGAEMSVTDMVVTAWPLANSIFKNPPDRRMASIEDGDGLREETWPDFQKNSSRRR